MTPLSACFGFERGTPIDRYYLDAFLSANRDDIHGDVLEIQSSGYTSLYGCNVRAAHTVDIDPRFEATFTCDLAHSDEVIPTDAFDRFLLPNTLTVLRDLDGCLRQALAHCPTWAARSSALAPCCRNACRMGRLLAVERGGLARSHVACVAWMRGRGRAVRELPGGNGCDHGDRGRGADRARARRARSAVPGVRRDSMPQAQMIGAIDLRSSVKQALQSIGFYRHRLATRPYPGVAILTYHGVRDDTWPAGTMRFEELHVTAARLSEQCQTLRHCTMLSASEWAGVANGTRPMPARAAMLSFDDGYRTVLTTPFPFSSDTRFRRLSSSAPVLSNAVSDSGPMPSRTETATPPWPTRSRSTTTRGAP